MGPKEERDASEGDLFRARLETLIDGKHELVKLSRAIDWARFDEAFGGLYRDGGRPALPTRLMAGLAILKFMAGLSDEQLTAQWVENPYYQFFTGEVFFQHKARFDRSSMTRWRQRLGDQKLEELLKESLSAARRAGAIRPKDVRRVTVDTTVQPANIAHPTDAKLLYTSIVRLSALARRHGLPLRQSYIRVGKRALIMAQRYAHAKQFKRCKREVKFLRVRLGRLIRDIRRKTGADAAVLAAFESELGMAVRLRLQERRQDGPKLYSLHAPHTECIGKGKAHKPYEFGCKVSLVTTNAKAPGGMFVLHAAALHGAPYDGHTLGPVIDALSRLTGAEPTHIYVDKGYQGHTHPEKHRVFRSGQKRGVHGAIKRELRRRSAIEPVIGHLKAEHRMNRNYLKGRDGDRANAVLAAAGYNFRRLARWLRLLLREILSDPAISIIVKPA